MDNEAVISKNFIEQIIDKDLEEGKYKKNLRKKAVSFILIFILFQFSYNKSLDYFKIQPSNIRETLSVPIQQTARYIKYHEEDLTEEDKKNISGLLNYDIIKTKYKPKLSDPVKATFNKYATKEDFVNYAKYLYNQKIQCFFTE